MHQSAAPVPDGCVPVSTDGTHCPNPVSDSDLAFSLQGVQNHCVGRGSSSAAAGSRDGGELLGAQQDAGGLRPGRPGAGDGAGRGDNGVRLDGYTAPLTASPYDPWHSEEYLLGCLVKLHGWHWLEPRVLKGPWRRPRVRSFMHPEGE